MGEYADMHLDGTLCPSCGDFVGDDSGLPSLCSLCAKEEKRLLEKEQKQKNIERNLKQKKTRCPIYSKKVKEVGLTMHINCILR